MGRTLGEAVAPVLDDLGALDAATRRWEQARDDECLSAYHFANFETRIQEQSPVLKAAARQSLGDRSPDLSDVFQRARSQQEVLTLTRLGRATAAAVARDPLGAPAILKEAIGDLRTDLGVRAEARARRFRSTRQIKGSEHPGVIWPATPRRPASRPSSEPAAPPAEHQTSDALSPPTESPVTA
jgi:hypothetical protein